MKNEKQKGIYIILFHDGHPEKIALINRTRDW